MVGDRIHEVHKSGMKRTQVYLREEESDALRKAAARSGSSVAALIRDAIRKVVLKPEATGPIAIYTGRLVTFTVPTTGSNQILALGAQGGNSGTFVDEIGVGGSGAEMGGDISPIAGEIRRRGNVRGSGHRWSREFCGSTERC